MIEISFPKREGSAMPKSKILLKKQLKKTRGIRLLPNGKWLAMWTDPRGMIVKRRFKTKTEAILARENAMVDIRQQRYTDHLPSFTFVEGVQRFLEYSKSNLKVTSHQADRRVAGRWLQEDLFRNKHLDEITPAHIERYKQQRASDFSASSMHPAPQVVSKRLVDFEVGRLKRLFNLCIEMGLCRSNPALKIKLFKADVRRTRYLTEEEEGRLISHATPALVPIIKFALHTGMRKGEILNLTWGEVDLTNKVVLLPAAKTKARRARYIPLNQPALDALAAGGFNPDRNALVFANARGRRRDNLHHAWRRAVVSAGIEDFRFHDLRHTFASRLVMKGKDLAVIRELLGHQDFSMTLRYAHLAKGRLAEAVQCLDESPTGTLLEHPKENGVVH